MRFVEKCIISKGSPLYKLLEGRCLLSNNVHNDALYAMRQHYFLKSGRQYTDVILPEIENKTLKNGEVYKYLAATSDNYKQLSANCAQQTVDLVCNEFKSFYSLIKKKKNCEYDAKVNPPKYRPSGDLFVVTYNKQALEKSYNSKGYIRLPNTDIIIPFELKHYAEMTQLKLVPIYGAIEVEVIYKVDEFSLKSENGRYMAIDGGVTNLATCVSNVMQSFIIDGRPVKTVNQSYNKIKAEEYSVLDKKVNKDIWKEINAIKYNFDISDIERKSALYPLYKEIVRTTRRLEQVSLYRRNFINDYFHKASSYIVNQAVENDIRTIFIGVNKGWKQEANMGKKNNQNFVSIPHMKLYKMIEYKANKVGIKVVMIEESYTSKASFLDNDYIPTYGKEPAEFSFSGYRVRRGLYKLKGRNVYINADVNGAFNILRKGLNADAEAVMPSRRGFVFNPVRVNLFSLQAKKSIKGVN